jgi:hypothetical protein
MMEKVFSMPVLLSDFDLLTWQWHDAQLHSIKIEYLAHGELALYLRAEINEYEDRSRLQELGIHSLLVEVKFSGVGLLRITGNADCDMDEVIVDWRPVKSNPRHHIITGNCGSLIELQFEEVWLQEITKYTEQQGRS